MADIYFQCRCGQSMAIHEHGVGRIASCVSCGARVQVPAYEIEFACEQCGSTMLAPLALGGSWLKCVVCGRSQTAPDAAGVRLWPTDSPPALAAEALAEVERPDLEPAPAERRRSARWLLLAPVLLALAFYAGVRLAPRMADLSRVARERPQAVTVRGERTLLPEKTVADFAEVGLQIQDRDRRSRLQEKAVKPQAPSKEEEPLLSVPPRPEGRQPGLPAGAPDEQSDAEIGAASSGPPPSSADKSVLPAPVLAHGADAVQIEKEREKAWSEIAETCAALGRLKRSGGRSAQSAEFLKKVGAARREIAAYTQTYANRDLDYLGWGVRLRRIYTHAFCREAATFEEAWRLFGEGLSLLEDSDPEDETIKTRVRMRWIIEFSHAWMQSRTEACAGLLDETAAWVMAGEPSAARYSWLASEPWLEIRLMKNANSVRPEQRAAFVEQRTRCLLDYVAQTGIPEERRVRALKSWIVGLDAGGRWAEASKAVESFRTKAGPPAIPNWYLARLWLALYGEGDWKKARETVRGLTDTARRGGRSGDARACRDVFEVYYSRIFSPGYELKRQSAERLNPDSAAGSTTKLPAGSGAGAKDAKKEVKIHHE